MERWLGKVAIVTGASSGIGEGIAKKLVEIGLNVVGLARRQEKMEELEKSLSGEKGKLYPIQTDLTKEEDILKAFKWAEDNLGPVHILVNNAGVFLKSSLMERSLDDWNQMIQTNFIALAIASREAIKSMKANKVDGHIININSILGNKTSSFPQVNLGSSSKHAATAFAKALRLELAHAESKIKVTDIHPGYVDTPILGPDRESDLFVELRRKNIVMSTEDMANAVVSVLSTPPHVLISTMIIQPVGEIL